MDQLAFDADVPKVCQSCGESKPLSEFPKNRTDRSGINRVCHVCNRAKARAWERANPDRVRERLREWRAIPENWEREKQLAAARRAADPEKAREASRRWTAENPERRKEIVRKSAAKNQDRKRAYSRLYGATKKVERRERLRRWKAENREWVREQNATRRQATPETVEYAEILLGDPCCFCGSRERPEIDHIDPIKLGGLNDWTNLTLACFTCNRRKSARTLLHALLAA